MRKKSILIIVFLMILVSAAAIAYAITWNSKVNVNTRALENKFILNLAPHQGQVKDLIHFNYDKVYVFEPYQPKKSMESLIGFKCNLLKETVNEGMMNILFVYNDSPVAYLYGYASNTGYYIDLPVGTYTKAEFDEMNYTVTKCEVGNSAGTPQTYLKYLFTK